ncbi:uncharacterized protein METZ01_LOCUS435087, partial [marine metagenome]
VQCLYAIAEDIGFSLCPLAINASPTPISSASVAASIFFSIPNP